MKKLLGISLLAAALTSTAAFAQMQKMAAPQGRAAAAASMPAPLQGQDPFLSASSNVAANVIQTLVGTPDVHFQGIVVAANGDTDIKFGNALNPAQRNIVTKNALYLVRSGALGYFNVIEAKAGQTRDELFRLYVVASTKQAQKANNDKGQVALIVAKVVGTHIKIAAAPVGPAESKRLFAAAQASIKNAKPASGNIGN